ncbi:Meiotic recombination protein SPO11 [Labeo rohita]|uniref:DNA topoisomerase (ATP-hydrolyzing) n=1 Tax=Labeo rohita TaxID=84645 RepID=A0ABQ8LJ22_LABRO|nr:Meiotic recombination protein SPO11 [Labeo rohita]
MADQFTEVDKLRETLRESLEMTDKPQEDISRQDVLTRIERVIQTIVITVSKGEAPVLSVMNRSSWANVRFHKSVGLVLKEDVSVKALRSLILKLLSVIYKLVQSDSYATKRDIYYNDPQLFGSQTTLDSIVDDVSCMLKVPRRSLHVLATSKGFISGALCYLEEDGTKVDCSSSSTAVPVSSNVNGIRSILPVYFNHGKGVPDVNSRLMVRKLWDTLHVPVFALSMAFEAHSLTVPSVLWLGLLPSDIQRYRVPEETIIPFSQADERKINSLRSRAYITCQPAWEREVETMQRLKQKAEIQSLASIAPHFLTRVYLPNKLRYGGWI